MVERDVEGDVFDGISHHSHVGTKLVSHSPYRPQNKYTGTRLVIGKSTYNSVTSQKDFWQRKFFS